MSFESEESEADVPDHCAAKDRFNELPEELQLKIFAHFTPPELSTFIAPVCKKWWILSKDVSLWKDLSFTISLETSITIFCEVILRCNLLNSLKIKSVIPVDCIIFCFIQLRPQFLREVDFAFCKGLNVETVAIIVSNCPQIECLNLEGCGLCIDYHCIRLIATLPHLRSLNLSRCFSIDDLCITTLATECQRLQLLNTDNVKALTDESICELAERRYEMLTHLFLAGDELSDQSMVALSTCRNLRTLCISCGELLTDETLLALSALPFLTWFRLRESANLSSSAFETFFENPHLSSLTILEFENVTIDDRGLEKLAKTCTNLCILSLLCCYDITDRGLKMVLNNCTKLYWLDLAFATQLMGESLIDIPIMVPKLGYLNLEQCCMIDVSLVQSLASKMPNLKINFDEEYHSVHTNNKVEEEKEEEIRVIVDKSLNVCWTKRPEGFS